MKFGINNPAFLQSACAKSERLKSAFFGIRSLEDNNTISFNDGTVLYDKKNQMEYSYDEFEWNALSGINVLTINKDENVYLRCSSGDIFVTSDSYSPLFSASGKIDIFGKLSSLCQEIKTDTAGCCSYFFKDLPIVSAKDLEFDYLILDDNSYYSMFDSCTNLVNAPKLSATNLAFNCYCSMFYGCTSLVNAPELPATNLADSCYYEMFYDCTSLVNAPELPATTLAEKCYYDMFTGCTSLVNAPELPATNLADMCYYSMFSGCTSLVNAPELPATNLADSCYIAMFSSCTSLVNAPELPATNLANSCYYRMFYNCEKINNVTCLAINMNNATQEWLYAVSLTGTFTKAAGVQWPTGNSGIPEGWTVQEYAGDNYEVGEF